MLVASEFWRRFVMAYDTPPYCFPAGIVDAVEPLEGYVGPDFTDHPDEVVARG